MPKVPRDLQGDLRCDRRVRLEKGLESARERAASTQSTPAHACAVRGASSISANSPNSTPSGISATTVETAFDLLADLDSSAQDEVERLALVPVVEYHLSLQVAPFVQQAVDDTQLLRLQRGEQAEPPERSDPGVFRPPLKETEHRRYTRMQKWRRVPDKRILSRSGVRNARGGNATDARIEGQ